MIPFDLIQSCIDKLEQLQKEILQAGLSQVLAKNEIIFPLASKNGVLWRWVDEDGMLGPFCPVHKIRLYYWPTIGSSRANFKEDDWLSGNASFVCPSDESEEFIFIRPTTMKVGQLRAQATDRFHSEIERAKVKDKEIHFTVEAGH